MLKTFRLKRRAKQDVHMLYKQLVDQARQPHLYQAPYNIEDEIEGRFSLILLHLFMVDRALFEASVDNEIRRMLQEALINDMDRSLRELGVGDMSVGKEMKKVGATLLGSMKSYNNAMDHDNTKDELKAAIQRNITNDENAAEALTAYTLETLKILSDKLPTKIAQQDNIFTLPNSVNS